MLKGRRDAVEAYVAFANRMRCYEEQGNWESDY